MAHKFEIAQDAEVDAGPEQIWEAIATGPGLDSWFMGRNEIEQREGGKILWSIGDYTAESTVTAWDRPRHFASKQTEAPDGSFHEFDYRIEPRDAGRTGIRYVHSGALGGDWEAEYEAMSEGDPAYLYKLVQYVTYFTGRFGVSVEAMGPEVTDTERVMTTFRRALGLGDEAAVGDEVRATLEGLGPIDGVVSWVSPHFVGVRSDDAIYAFIHGFEGTTMVGHHLFADGVDRQEAESAWRSWLGRLFAPTDGAAASA